MKKSREFMNFLAKYFSIDLRTIENKSKISSLTFDLHASIRFSFEVEKHYGISFTDDEIEKLDTVNDYMVIIDQKLKQKNLLKKAA